MPDIPDRREESVAKRLREHYDRLESQSRDLLQRDFNFVERFVTQSRLAKLADRLAVEEQEEALQYRLEMMQLARVAQINNYQIEIRKVLGIKQAEVDSELTARVSEFMTDLVDRLGDQEGRMVDDFGKKWAKLEAIQQPELKERYKRALLSLLDKHEEMTEALLESAMENLKALSAAYAPRTTNLRDTRK